jgi:hypothetical protein
MRNTKNTNSYLIGLIVIFTLIILCVEVVKKLESNRAMIDVFDHSANSSNLLILPLLSIGILVVMAVPRVHIYKLGYYATTLGLILINALR